MPSVVNSAKRHPYITAGVICFAAYCGIRQVAKRILSDPSWAVDSRHPDQRTDKGNEIVVRLGEIKFETKIKALILKVCRTITGPLSLPHLPLAPLEPTLERLKESLKPLLTTQQYTKACETIDAFKPQARRLYNKLWWYSFMKVNWLSEMWLKGAYLINRAPLETTNWYGIIKPWHIKGVGEQEQTMVAAYLMHAIMHVMKNLKSTPSYQREVNAHLCMTQMDNILGTYRVAKQSVDEIRQSSQSRHVLVICNNHYYRVDVIDQSGNIRSKESIFADLEDIRQRPHTNIFAFADLSSADRDAFAKCREEARGDLETAESALFAIALDPKRPENLDDQACKTLLTARNRWYGYALHGVVYANGALGSVNEHSPVDAPAVGMIFQEVIRFMQRKDLDPIQAKSQSFAQEIKISPPDDQRVQTHLDQFQKRANEVDIKVLRLEFGKGFMKKLRLSPDSFIQMAMQVAFYDCFGSLKLTYQSAMTRFFQEGRTETIRSGSMAAKKFVLSMKSDASSQVKRQALEAAIDEHVAMKRLCMRGQGIDRLMLGLRVVAHQTGEDTSFFTDPTVNPPWDIATSSFDSECGGGYLPLTDQGFGVFYVVHENELWFHISSKNEQSEAFSLHLSRALEEMRELYQGVKITHLS